MTDLEMFAEDATQDVFDATVKYGNPVSFETAYKYIVEGEPGIVAGPFDGDSNMRHSSVFKGYCKRYWKKYLKNYVDYLIKEAA